jgi:hypothetical protein
MFENDALALGDRAGSFCIEVRIRKDLHLFEGSCKEPKIDVLHSQIIELYRKQVVSYKAT